ncbi:MAG: right-handed parallel beta-helix repeat-containing protein [Planctomycetaceae bacterium]|nr:right-handed parallel beta-helix repeat-containing protein [Planctomycetaceae bacterium]
MAWNCSMPVLGEQIPFDKIVLSLYVSPDGDDANPGTEDKPFQTIARAQKAIRETVTKEDGNKEVHILAGEYCLTEPLRFGTEDGGVSRGNYDKLVFYEGHDATISGGKKITGFKDAGNGIVSVVIPEVKSGDWTFRDLYVNEKRMTRARFPNEGFLRVEKAGDDRRTNFFFQESDALPKVRDLDQVELVFLHDWAITRTPVKSIDFEKRQLTVPVKIGGNLPFLAIDGFEPHPRYFLENSFDYLDAPGEWFLDVKTGTLYYKLRDGETAENIHVVAPAAKQLLVVGGTEEHPVTNLHFIGLNFAYTAFQEKPQKIYWGIQAATYSSPNAENPDDPNGYSFLPADAAIQIDHANTCTFDTCSFRHLGENGLWLRKSCYANILEKCEFEDIGANGCMFGTHENANTAKCNSVLFSKVTKTGQTLYGSVGIWVGLTQNTTIDRCEISETPYTGISLGWAWNPQPTSAKENSVLGCHIHHNMLLLSDGGGIYTLGNQPGSRLGFNRIHDIPVNAGRAESNGMFLDEGTTGFTIDFNLITNTQRSPLRFHQAGKNTVSDNFFSLESEETPMIRYNSTPEENIAKQNNTVLPKDKIAELEKAFHEAVKNKVFDYRTR